MLRKLTSDKLFILLVIIPTTLAIIYNLFIATPIYISESKVIIKQISAQESASGLTSFLGALGVLQPSTYGGYLIMDYINSRDVMMHLEKLYNLKKYYSSEEWDLLRRFDPFGLDPSYENFYEYYKNKIVETYIDLNSGVITLRIRAKDPNYAYNLNKEIIKLSENFINLLNVRSSKTALSYYEKKLIESRKKLSNFSEKVKQFLVKTKTFSPEQQIANILSMLTNLQSKLIEKEIELASIRSVAPRNPIIPTLENQIKSLKNEIKRLTNELINKKGSLATYSVELELLKMEFTLLQREVELYLQAYLNAQTQFQLQHLFIETVESPVKPDAPVEPKVFRNIFLVFAISFAVWGVLSILIAGIKEHVGE